VLEAGACLLILPSPSHTLMPLLQIESKVSVTCSTTQMKNQWEMSLSIYKKFVPSHKFTGGGACKDRLVLTLGGQARNGRYNAHPGSCGIDPLCNGPNLEKIRPEAGYLCALVVVAYLKRYVPLEQVVSEIQRRSSRKACSHKSSRVVRANLACASIRTVQRAGKAVGKWWLSSKSVIYCHSHYTA
jgi:hypothetical protein